MAPKKKGKGKKKEQRTTKGIPSGTDGAHLRTRAPSAADTEIEVGDTAVLVGLRGRADLNGKRVEVESRVVGKDGAPRFMVRVLGGGLGEVVKVRAANLELEADGVLDPALETLVEALKALAPEGEQDRARTWWNAAWGRLAGRVSKLVRSAASFTFFATIWGVSELLGAAGHSTIWVIEGLGYCCTRFYYGRYFFWASVIGVMFTWTTAAIILMALGCWIVVAYGWWGGCFCAVAAGTGNLKTLQWLRARGCPWSDRTCKMAAQFGFLDVLRWAHENGCEWGVATCYNAAEGGHLQILQWLRANGCPWDSDTCLNAAAEGHLDVLRWARKNGCEWDAWTRDRAAAKLGYTDDLGNLVEYTDSEEEESGEEESEEEESEEEESEEEQRSASLFLFPVGGQQFEVKVRGMGTLAELGIDPNDLLGPNIHFTGNME